jgi:lipopolysaccharide/colanic/teichoic acid biosynthesis glycosyltransferase
MKSSQAGQAKLSTRILAFDRGNEAAASGTEVARTARPGPSQVKPVYAVPVVQAARNDAWPIEALYRLFEIVVALVGLIVGLPIMLIEGMLVRFETPGPALFHQRRMARSRVVQGRELKDRLDLRFPTPGLDPDAYYYVPTTFPFMKFRTMYHDARKRFPELYDYSFQREDFHGSYTKSGGVNDPRITPLGRFLRASTIDELPNLWCVLVGDMRLVGPRPEISEVVHAYSPEEMYKFSVKPGITGLAQTNGRGMLPRGETLKWDLEYLRTRTVWLDLKIICKTIWLVLSRHGAF